MTGKADGTPEHLSAPPRNRMRRIGEAVIQVVRHPASAFVVGAGLFAAGFELLTRYFAGPEMRATPTDLVFAGVVGGIALAASASIARPPEAPNTSNVDKQPASTAHLPAVTNTLPAHYTVGAGAA